MHFVPLSKWEVPSHISAISVGYDIGVTIILSQAHHQRFVRINSIQGNEKARVLSPMSVEENGRDTHQLIVPVIPIRVSLLSSIATKVFVPNFACNTETVLRTDKTAIAATGATVLGNGLRTLVTVDNKGLLSVYGWMDHLIQKSEPIMRSRIPRNPEKMCVFADPGNPHALLLGVSYLGRKLTFFRFNFKSALLEANLIK
uniref:MMS1_N domain-containing protein n=1 Tax=Steinernema glaseri TaxID=37863 RepID=A0A1I8A5L3_9BILA